MRTTRSTKSAITAPPCARLDRADRAGRGFRCLLCDLNTCSALVWLATSTSTALYLAWLAGCLADRSVARRTGTLLVTALVPTSVMAASIEAWSFAIAIPTTVAAAVIVLERWTRSDTALPRARARHR